MHIETISQKAQDIINRYSHLQIGKENIIVPYYINLKHQLGGLRVMSGKGSPSEIEHEVKVWAQVKGFDLQKADAKQIREFMQKECIGIDCSGLVVYIINEELASRNLSNIWNYLTFDDNKLVRRIRRFFRPVENISANLLTNINNTVSINNLDEIKPSDLIRSKWKRKNSHHIAIVTKTERDNNLKLTAFEYVNSNANYGDNNGLRTGRVEIKDISLGLKEQTWIDNDENNTNYFLEGLMLNYADNGIRRLNILNTLPGHKNK